MRLRELELDRDRCGSGVHRPDQDGGFFRLSPLRLLEHKHVNDGGISVRILCGFACEDMQFASRCARSFRTKFHVGGRQHFWRVCRRLPQNGGRGELQLRLWPHLLPAVGPKLVARSLPRHKSSAELGQAVAEQAVCERSGLGACPATNPVPSRAKPLLSRLCASARDWEWQYLSFATRLSSLQSSSPTYIRIGVPSLSWRKTFIGS